VYKAPDFQTELFILNFGVFLNCLTNNGLCTFKPDDFDKSLFKRDFFTSANLKFPLMLFLTNEEDKLDTDCYNARFILYPVFLQRRK